MPLYDCTITYTVRERLHIFSLPINFRNTLHFYHFAPCIVAAFLVESGKKGEQKKILYAFPTQYAYSIQMHIIYIYVYNAALYIHNKILLAIQTHCTVNTSYLIKTSFIKEKLKPLFISLTLL